MNLPEFFSTYVFLEAVEHLLDVVVALLRSGLELLLDGRPHLVGLLFECQTGLLDIFNMILYQIISIKKFKYLKHLQFTFSLVFKSVM